MCENQFGLNWEKNNYNNSNDGYETFLDDIKRRFNEVTEHNKIKLFTTDAKGLWEAFLNGLPQVARQHYNCRSCRRFIENFGGLLAMSEDGSAVSPLWNQFEVPLFFSTSVENMSQIVHNTQITGVFLSDTRVLGKPHDGEWEHIAITLHHTQVSFSKLYTAEQLMAEKVQDFETLQNALRAYSLDTIKQAVSILEADAVSRSEKSLGKAEWFLELAKKVKKARTSDQHNKLIWYAVATAPVGFTHIRSGVLGTLLDDIASGMMSFDVIKRRFDEKMRADRYQRPQAAPKAGNIKRGNEIIAKLGLERSLNRRYARIDELKLLWTPKRRSSGRQNNPISSGGVFDNVKPRETQRFNARPTNNKPVPTVTMTWEKFAKTVLPKAHRIEYWAGNWRSGYAALVTAEDPTAPPIIQWDKENDRNPVSWYQYANGSVPSNWNLESDMYHEVTGITYQPSMWNEDESMKHQGKGVILILDGAKDRNHSQVSNALFPEILRSELHEIRATIEEYSRNERLTGHADSACGIRLQAIGGGNWRAKVRVTTDLGVAVYELDRWD